MKVIVTGGAGFIGSNFIFYMMKKHPDYDIICLDSLTYAGNLSTLKSVMDDPHFKFVKLDIRDRDGVYKLFCDHNAPLPAPSSSTFIPDLRCKLLNSHGNQPSLLTE